MVAITRAMAAVLLKVMSDLKYRLVNDISSPLMNQSDGRTASMTLLYTSLCPFRDGKRHNHVVRHSSSPIMHNVTTVRAGASKRAQTALQFAPASVNQLLRGCNKAKQKRGAPREPIPGIFMIFGLFRKRNHNQIIVVRQYETLTFMARQPVFYTDYNVPDTVMGRFELLSVMMILFFRRTRSSATSGQELAQEIVDAFFEDIDYSIRELGIGDNSVPKRMKKLAGMFYGRLESYASAMDVDDRAALAVALQRNIYPKANEAAASMSALADWMLVAEAHLATVAEDQIATGSATLPVPDKVGQQAG
ncbi:hypothetical protein GGD54_002386 [Rhizobium tropici]|uniref:Ubiquinol-cytochrome c chaperone domain-containing protein n=2 Tax=Rhizobium tropici TaxID=398 RepID=A0ABR6QXU4_RHITR|nr:MULTISPECIES: ubiquinol-cytochrome C chaperone family protein [Rhizobium]MBB4241661.1 hypothetical protein [Rhizobium tropici]MBB5592599.1 hypothetical protein [Rhizobium tropici]MBB6491641.1 hypothetical protein [Rhizobium tropici]